MSPETYGLLLLTGTSLVGIGLAGMICLRVGRKNGYEIGVAHGHADGWRDAHERVSAALNVPPENLNLILLERELGQPNPEEGTSAGRLMVERFRAAARDDQAVKWGEESFS